MGTSLYLITNAKLSGKENTKDWDSILGELKAIDMNRSQYFNDDGKLVYDEGDWEYYIEEENEDFPFSVHFEGPYPISPSLYSNLGIIHTIYRYSWLYKMYAIEELDSFRLSVFNVVKAIGGTEVIYLADNACDKLSSYLELRDRKSVV